MDEQREGEEMTGQNFGKIAINHIGFQFQEHFKHNLNVVLGS